MHLSGATMTLRSCWVAPEQRGSGLREQLLAARMEWAGLWDVCALRTVVAEPLASWWTARGWNAMSALPETPWSSGAPRIELTLRLSEEGRGVNGH